MNCIECHSAADLVSANLAYFASAEAVYNPRPGPRPHDVPPPAASCTECHGIGQELSVSLLATELGTGTGSGGGMYNANSSWPTLMNCTFSSNEAGTGGGGGMYSDVSSTATVTNCILWGDTPDEIAGDAAAVTYSCVKDGDTNNNNIADNPLFVDAANDNLRLRLGSPCIDTGTPDGAPEADIRGVPRPQDGGYDMGVYEFYYFAITTQPQSLTVDEGDPASFSVEVSGGLGSLAYQWMWDDADIEDENASIYTIESAQTGNEGRYACLVADDYDRLVSDIATLTVIPETMPVGGPAGLIAAVLAAGLLGALRLRRRMK